MRRLFHVSDIHFGREDRDAIAWFERLVADERPDAIVMTGDLTMRARAVEFERASTWLRSLATPMTVEVGNHDLPYFNPLVRLFRPYHRYDRVERAIERPLDLPEVAIVPLRTTARFQWRWNWSKGRVGDSTLAETVRAVREVAGGRLVLIACHHPLVDAGTRSSAATRGGARALEALAQAGADAVLSGHVHDPFDVEHRFGDRRIRTIGAGTLSERTRDYRPSFNEIRVADGRIDLMLRILPE